MEKPNLKEQPADAYEGGATLHPRFAQPQPATVMERFCAALKRLGILLLLAAATVAIFLAIPLRHWDQHADWQDIRASLTRLAAQPDSPADMQRLHNAAAAAGLLWEQPSGPRPTKWHPLQSRHYDAAYEVVQTLALSIIRQGNTARGLNELERLGQRAEPASASHPLASLQKRLSSAKNQVKSKLTACPMCKGKGWTTLGKEFPLKAALRNTRAADKKLQENAPLRQNCPSCQGSGKQAAPGSQPAPSGAGTPAKLNDMQADTARIISSAPSLFTDSVKGAILSIDEGMALWRPLHAAANAQRSIFRSVGVHVPDKRPNAGTTIRVDPFAYVRTASEALLASPLNEQHAQVIADTAKSEDNPAALRNLAMSAFGISLLLRNNTGTYARVCAIQKSTFAEPYPAPIFTASDYIANCKDCGGKGERPYPCPSCMGPNGCKTCKGKGQTTTVAGTSPCPSCKNAPTCLRCKGGKSVTATCTTCRGEKKMIKPSARVQTAYGEVLTNLIAYCDSAASAETLLEAEPDTAPPPSRSGILIPALILVIAALPITLLTCLVMKRKRAQQFSALPGMQNIDADKFTDPLSLNAQKARNQAKRKTARLPIPDEYKR